MERDQQDTECIWCGRKASAKCQGCQSAVYCDSACQKKDWAVHMRICKESRSIGRRPSRAARLELFLLKIHKPELRWIASYDERKAIMGRGSCSGSSVLHNARLCKDIKAEYTCFYDGNSFGNTGYNLTINTINNGDTVDDHRIRGAGTRLEHRGVWLA